MTINKEELNRLCDEYCKTESKGRRAIFKAGFMAAVKFSQPTQQVSKELIKEIIIEYEAYRNVCKENAEVPLALFEWLDGQELPNNISQNNGLDKFKTNNGIIPEHFGC